MAATPTNKRNYSEDVPLMWPADHTNKLNYFTGNVSISAVLLNHVVYFAEKSLHVLPQCGMLFSHL